ncbi:MAG: SpoIIE family protein phosphatase, partial [Thermacetogeniaceae bacterium]
FCSGILRGLGRVGILLGFGVGILLFSFFYETGAGLQEHLIASALASAIYLACSPFLDRLLGSSQRVSRPHACRLRVETGFAQLAKPDEPLCGDSMVATPLDSHRFLLVVSDGMGTGVDAGRESRIVTRMVEELVSSGTPLDVAAGVVNTALYMRGGEESAATIDLALIDLSLGIAEFLKAGAPPSFIKSGRSVEMIRSICWPAGILDKLEPEVLRRNVQPGDLLVMVTDGVTGVEEGGSAPGEWLYGFLQGLAVEEPQAVADLILKQALKGDRQRRDDMTVLVARFLDISDAG